MLRAALALLAVSAVTASSARADRRLFTYTYEYRTTYGGDTSLELWHTETRTTWDAGDSGAATLLESMLDIEHGLTDRWDVSLYFVATQTASHDPALPSQALRFDQIALDTRYRFADRGELPVDLLALARIAKQFGQGSFEAEARGVLARDLGAFTAAVNAIATVDFGPDVDETTFGLGWAAGLTYELHPKANLGVETYGTIDLERSDTRAAVGPVLAFAPTTDLWLALTASFGIGDAPAVAGRLLLGIDL